jgi:hypothetical protein
MKKNTLCFLIHLKKGLTDIQGEDRYPPFAAYIRMLNPDTANIYGIDEGNRVLITTKNGKISQKAVFGADIDQRVVRLDYVWWFPEKEGSILFGQSNSNVNIFTYGGEPSGRKMSTPDLLGIKCAIAGGLTL